MSGLIKQTNPALVIDATHPYAEEASRNIAAACVDAKANLLRVIRESEKEPGCIYFISTDDLVSWLEATQGNIFVTTGVSRAEAFTRLENYKKRVWLRVLPAIESIKICMALGYGADRLVCMQGPFTEELNRAMFAYANAEILVTKESGAAGGFVEKVRAAQSLNMTVAVLSKPSEQTGVLYDEACRKILELIR
jgi:precorrin-6Y C5,15-methyltransferase (decarboxylating)